jgi:hypothetical protein
MSAPWVNGTVEAVAEHLRRVRQTSPTNTGLIYAAATGMIRGLAGGYTPGQTLEQRMADIVTVLDAVELVEKEGQSADSVDS